MDIVGKREDIFVVAGVVLKRDLGKRGVSGAGYVDDVVVQHFLALVEKFNERADPALIAEVGLLFLFAALIGKDDADAAVQKRLLAQTGQQRIVVEHRLFKDLRVGLERDLCASDLALADLFKRKAGDAAFIPLHHHVFAVEIRLDFQPLRQGVDDAGADPMEAAGDLVPAAAELSAGVENGVDDLDGGDMKLLVFARRDTAAVIGDADDVSGQDGDGDGVAGAGKRFVDGVVYDLVDQMVQPAQRRRADVHARAFSDRFQPLQNLNLFFVVVFYPIRFTHNRLFCSFIGLSLPVDTGVRLRGGILSGSPP